MKRSTRRIIFFGFILIFLIVTPGVLFYASGYSFDWENKQIIKTGSFYFQSQPSEAKVLIDGKLVDITPSYIGRLVPGTYQVQISKDGFSTWQKKLNIQEQLATEARNIFLIPQKPRIESVAQNVTSTKEYFLTQQEKDVQKQAVLTASSTLKDVLGFTEYQNNIYYLQRSNLILYRSDLSGNNKEQISLDSLPALDQRNTGAQIKYEVVISPEQTTVYEPGGKLYLLDKQTKIFNLLADGIQGLEFSSDNEKVLYWTDHEIWVLWLKEVWAQPYRKAGDKELITRYSDKITQVIWLARTNEQIIYCVADQKGEAKIKLTELDGRDIRNTYDIYSAGNPEIYWNQNNDLLYILIDHTLNSVDLLKV